MPKITNVSARVLMIGRFKLLPGASLPVVPYSSREHLEIDHFAERGFITVEDAKNNSADPVAEAPVVEVPEDRTEVHVFVAQNDAEASSEVPSEDPAEARAEAAPEARADAASEVPSDAPSEKPKRGKKNRG